MKRKRLKQAAAAALLPLGALGQAPAFAGTPGGALESMEARESDTVGSSASAPAAAPAGRDLRPVTQEQFKELLRIYKRTVDRFDKLEAKVKAGGTGGAPGGEEAIDLTGLSSANVGEAPVATGRGGNHARVGASAVPDFKVYFDFNLVNRPGIEPLSFDNFHSLLFFELLPTPDLQFSFDVSTSPRYFELDYQVTPKLQLRWGKIWIPFDDMAPHNIFGGRVNVSRLGVPGAPSFLPDLWTDLGMGFKYTLVDSLKFRLETHGYVVNGFRSGGRDPLDPTSPYPLLSDLPTSADNNRDKAVGGRVHAMIAGKFGLGASIYSGQWNDDGSAEAKRLLITGFDSQLRLANTELRAGLVSMAFNLPTSQTANRGGAYVELGQKFGSTKAWKILGRGGVLQFDDRALDTSTQTVLGDQELVGLTLLWKPGLIQYSIEHSRDLKESPNKINYTFTNFRIVMAF